MINSMSLSVWAAGWGLLRFVGVIYTVPVHSTDVRPICVIFSVRFASGDCYCEFLWIPMFQQADRIR